MFTRRISCYHYNPSGNSRKQKYGFKKHVEQNKVIEFGIYMLVGKYSQSYNHNLFLVNQQRVCISMSSMERLVLDSERTHLVTIQLWTLFVQIFLIFSQERMSNTITILRSIIACIQLHTLSKKKRECKRTFQCKKKEKILEFGFCAL